MMRCLLLSILLLFAAVCRAGVTVGLSSAQGSVGDEVELVVSLAGAAEATAFQMNIPLPPQLSYVEGSATVNAQRLSASHEMAVSQVNGLLSVYLYSISLDLLQGTEGELLRLRLHLGNQPGNYVLQPTVVVSTPAAVSLSLDTQPQGTVTILAPEIGVSTGRINFGRVPIHSSYTQSFELNNTGNEPLHISDITSTLPHLMATPRTVTIAPGQQQTVTLNYAPEVYGHEQATLTIFSDGVNGPQTISIEADPYSVNELMVESAQGGAWEEATVGVSLRNMEPIVALQCSFILPEGLTYVEGSATLSGTRVTDHQIAATVAGQHLQFFIHSPTNSALTGTDGQLFTFRLLLQSTGGTYQIEPSEVLLSNISGQDMTSAVYGADVRIAAPLLVCDTTADFGSVPLEVPARMAFFFNNEGELPLVVERIVFSDEAFSATDLQLPLIVAPGATQQLTLQYEPQTSVDFSGYMQLYTNDPAHCMEQVNLVGTTYSTNRLTLSGEAVDSQPTQYALTIGMQNALPIVAMQFDIHWTEGMTTNEDLITLTERAAGHTALVTALSPDFYRVYVYAPNNTAIAPGEGDVLRIIYNNVEEQNPFEGTSVTIDNVILSTADGHDCCSAPAETFIVGGLLGDANGDGEVTVTDVATIIGYLMDAPLPRFIRTLADVDGDGHIGITDVVGTAALVIEQ